MTIELTEDERNQIEGWYNSAAGESATDRTAEMFALLDKLGIVATDSDLYPLDPSHYTESHQPVIYAKIAAIKAYRERHPEIESDED